MPRLIRISILAGIVTLVPPMAGGHFSVYSADKVVWRWHESGTELYQPQFSATGDEITLVRKIHTPDGDEAESISEKEIEKSNAQIAKDSRYADPQIITLRIGDDKPTIIDWGWSPSFSPDGNYIAYSHQLREISRYRVLAATLAGNDIRIYDRGRKTSTIVATPANGYLTEPIFSPDNKYVAYSLGDAVNGAYGGNVGVGRVDLKTKKTEILYPPSKTHELYHLIRKKRYVSASVIALRLTPTTTGIYLAESYVYNLLDLGPPPATVYTWGQGKLGKIGADFASTVNGNLLIYDGGWRKILASNSHPKATLDGHSNNIGHPSPEGRRLAEVSTDEIVIRDMETLKELHSFKFKGRIQSLEWSPNSRRLAVIETHYKDTYHELFSYDELIVLSINGT